MSASHHADVSKPTLSVRSSGRHQIKRSISELTSPVRLHRHHQHRRDRQNDDREFLAANPTMPSRRSFDVSRSDGPTPMITPDQSRRASVMLNQEPDLATASGEPREEDIRREQERAKFRTEGLKQSLVDLTTFSTRTSKRLDDTYFGVLEKMSTLKNTVAALKDLAETSRDIHTTFEKSAHGLESDIVTQLGAVGRFEDQQRRIESFQGRIHSGRGKMQSLSQRVDLVRQRIESWEKADKEWREKTRKRLRVIWTIMSIIFLAVVCLLLSIRFSSGSEWSHGSQLVSNVSRPVPPSAGLANESGTRGPRQADTTKSSGTLPWEKRGDGGERLRAFDEL